MTMWNAAQPSPAPDPGAGHAETVELQSLLQSVYENYGYDFRNYADGPLRRRVWRCVHDEALESVGALERRLATDRGCLTRLLARLSVHVTSMFRDPTAFLAFRKHAVPMLSAQPFIRLWVAGCSTGEEAYSLAILLHEEGLYERCRIYATDISSGALARARAGIFPLSAMREYTQHYIRAGGNREFSEYYTAGYGHAMLHRSLGENIVFAQHNLASDGLIHQFHAVVSRNVLIYFNRELQDRAHRLIHQSLVTPGVLFLGSRESLVTMPHENSFVRIAPGESLFCKVT